MENIYVFNFAHSVTKNKIQVSAKIRVLFKQLNVLNQLTKPWNADDITTIMQIYVIIHNMMVLALSALGIPFRYLTMLLSGEDIGKGL